MMGTRINFSRMFSVSQLEGDPRKAAMLVHAMSVSDQRWLLAQLSAPQRELLQRLLNELNELGIPVAHDFLREVLAAQQAAVRKQEEGAGPKSIEDELDAANHAALIEILDREPAALIVRLMQVRAWSWAEPVLAGLRESKRRQVEAVRVRAPASGSAQTGIDRHLLALLKNQLARRHAVAEHDTQRNVASRKTSVWRRVFDRTFSGSWFRPQAHSPVWSPRVGGE
jgi:hypothetical protein